jgi:FtsH-binding integral membrane protein
MTWISFNWLKLLAIVFLLGAYYLAINNVGFPFAYYQYLNWVVLGASLVLAQQANYEHKMVVVWLSLLVAVTFNPITPMYFRNDIWVILDLVVAALFIISFFFVTPKSNHKS